MPITRIFKIFPKFMVGQDILNMQVPLSRSEQVALRPFKGLLPWPKSLRKKFPCANRVEAVSRLAFFGLIREAPG